MMGWVFRENPRIPRQQAESRLEDVFYLEPMKLYSVLTLLRQLGERELYGYQMYQIIYESATCS